MTILVEMLLSRVIICFTFTLQMLTDAGFGKVKAEDRTEQVIAYS